MPFFEPGEVRVADDEDFKYFKHLCEDPEGWHEEYHKRELSVWMRSTPNSNFHMFKIRTTYKDIPAPVLYDVLHDPEYRKVWDKSMIEGREICFLNPNNDIGYFALRSPPPFSNRDFVTQRSWLGTPEEYVIFNHSVFHSSCPPKKNFIRAVSFITGYLIRPLTPTSCIVTYVSQSDPRGKLPAWIINKTCSFIAPSYVKRLKKTARNYVAWKNKHNPNWKPWIFPEQIDVPRINYDHVNPKPDFESDSRIDETTKREGKEMDKYLDDEVNGGNV